MDWNEFMDDWDSFHRNRILPFIKQTDFNTRREINRLLTDMKSSLKWCRKEECIRIKDKLQSFLNQQ